MAGQRNPVLAAGTGSTGAPSHPVEPDNARDRIARVGQAVASQRLALAPIDLPPELRPRDEAEAYAIQAAGNRLLSAAGLGAPAGHKIGCTTPVMQAYLGIPNPCAGEIFSATMFEPGAVLDRAAYRRLGVECEIAVRFGRAIPQTAQTLTRESVASYVDSLHAGIELVDERYRDFREFGAQSLITDNFFGAGCVLGPPVRDWWKLDLSGLAGRMAINGEEAGRGHSGMILGHPFEALAWLANSRTSRGLGIAEDAIVFLGSIVETRWLNAGDTVAIEVDSLGAFGLTVS